MACNIVYCEECGSDMLSLTLDKKKVYCDCCGAIQTHFEVEEKEGKIIVHINH